MNAVSVGTTALVPIEIAKDEFTIFLELGELELLVSETELTANKLSQEYVRITMEMQTMFRHLETLNSSFMDDMKKLGAELDFLEEKRLAKEKAEREAAEGTKKGQHTPEEYEYQNETEPDPHLSDSNENAKKVGKDLKRKCKRLYFKISNRCHPDKVKRKDLNDFFIQASKAYEKLDLAVLEEVWGLVQTGKSLHKAALERKLREAEERARLCHIQLSHTLSTGEYQSLLQMYRHETSIGDVDHPRTRSIFLQNCLEVSKRNIISRIRQLDPSRYPPTPVAYGATGNMFINGVTISFNGNTFTFG